MLTQKESRKLMVKQEREKAFFINENVLAARSGFARFVTVMCTVLRSAANAHGLLKPAKLNARNRYWFRQHVLTAASDFCGGCQAKRFTVQRRVVFLPVELSAR